MRSNIHIGVLSAILATGLAWTTVGAPEDGLGIGIIVGEPTGVSVKKWIGPRTAVDAAAAWSFSENDSFQFHTDYLIHNDELLDAPDADGRLSLYTGIGGRVKLKESGGGRNNDDVLVGVRVPLGITYLVERAPFDFFLEVVPVLDVVPDTDFDVNAALGVRFYFP